MSSKSDLGQIDHKISLEKAIQMITSFRKALPSIVQPDYVRALPFSETFSKSVFEELVRQPGAVGVKAYLGMDDEKQVRLIFVATNDRNEDILSGKDEEASIYEYGQRCPPICSVGPLNPDL